MSTIEITVPVTPATAERWRDPAKRVRLGSLLSAVTVPGASQAEVAEAVRLFVAPEAERRRALRNAFADIQHAAAQVGITPEEVEAELTAWKRERASRRR
jgi:hypothetical protein